MTDPNRPINEPDYTEDFEPDASSGFEPEYDPQFDPEPTDASAYRPPAETAQAALPDPNRRLGRTGPLWGALVVILAVVLTLFLLLRGDGNETPTVPAIQVTAGAPGGALIPTETPLPTATPLPPTATPIPVLAPGQRVRIANTDNEGIRFRADASTQSITQEIYNDGAIFTVLEPSGDYDSYPVEAEGFRWYRLQADDGLVGWTVYEFLEVVDQE